MSKITALNHVILTVSDPTRTNAFYRDVLGFETTEEDGGGFYFSLGDVMLFYYPPRQPLANDRFSEERIGLDHLSFTAPDRETLDALAAKLIAAGVETKGIECFEATGNFYIAFRDPDNMQLEFWLP
jgi:glyoxylase I family protein